MTPQKLFDAARNSIAIARAIEAWSGGHIPTFEAMLIELVLILDRQRTGTVEEFDAASWGEEAAQRRDRAFQEFKRVYDQFPDLRAVHAQERDRQRDARMVVAQYVNRPSRCYRCRVAETLGVDGTCRTVDAVGHYGLCSRCRVLSFEESHTELK